MRKINNKTFNIGGGPNNALSLKQLTNKCKNLTQNEIKFKKIKKLQFLIFHIMLLITQRFLNIIDGGLKKT